MLRLGDRWRKVMITVNFMCPRSRQSGTINLSYLRGYKIGTAFHPRLGPWNRLPHSEQNFGLTCLTDYDKLHFFPINFYWLCGLLYLQDSLHFLSQIEIYLCMRILLVKCYQSQRVLDDDLRHDRNYLASTQAFSHQHQCSVLTRISTASDKCRKLPSSQYPNWLLWLNHFQILYRCEGEA